MNLANYYLLKFDIKTKGHHSIWKRGRPKSIILQKISTLDGFCVILNIYLSNNLSYAYTVLKNK